MRKKLGLIIVMAASVIATLTGCCKHEWQEATCVAPRTCSLCGKTDGEVVDHTWQEATCELPKTCAVCGATEGEPLGHKFSEAGYLTPAVCSVCGAEGDVKPNYFVEKGLNLVDTVPETIEGPYMIFDKNKREDFITKTNPSNLSVASASNGDGTKTITVEYDIPLTCEYHYDTEKEYYFGIMNSYLYDLYTGQGIEEKETNGDDAYNTSCVFDIDGKETNVDVSINLDWSQGEWYAISDTVEGIDLLLKKTYTVITPEDYDGLVFGVKSFVKNTTEEEAAQEPESKVFYADFTGNFDEYESGGLFVRVGQ